ncbi:MAG: redoxin domain-containing protein [Anaerolineae bacterium]|nr:redoxin domain-containing protein [Anaerolineae bacterium]
MRAFRHRPRLLMASFVLLLSITLLVVSAQDQAGDKPPVGDPAYPAPDFPEGVDWINVPATLTFQQLRGKVVLLDFWTYGCINCIHMMPTIKQLEEKYGDALAVIGVHSAKFANEGQTENIRQIVQRYGLTHPVIADNQFAVWNEFAPYGVNAWPTFVVVDPRGNLYAVQAGEIPFEAFDQVIGGMIGYFDGLGEINRDPVQLTPEGGDAPDSALYFPGKVTADPKGGRLFIADSSHNRLVIADLNTYEILDVVGSGAAGFENGDYASATFNKPQGMALEGDTLYVADTDNHAIRTVNLLDRTVSTIAGTGKQGYNRTYSGNPLTMDLSSPWDVWKDGNALYVAMAGTHQIWVLISDTGEIGPLVGSGREGLADGNFDQAQLAQPSGLFYRGGILYFADSESSSIRAADIELYSVTTLAGPTVNDLFDFGDADGGLGTGKLQHTLAVVGGDNGLLYVADTYNSKIKVVDPQTNELTTLVGLGSPGGYRDGDAETAAFDEPGGLAYADGKLYVADTNNQAIRVIDLAAKTVSTVQFPNPEALQIGGEITVVGGGQGVELSLPLQTVAAGSGEIRLNVVLPEGYKLNANIPFIAEWSSDADAVQIAEADRQQSIPAPQMPLRVPVTLSEGQASLSGDLTIYYCESVNESLCFIDQVKVAAPISVTAAGGESTIQIERTITPPTVPTA